MERKDFYDEVRVAFGRLSPYQVEGFEAILDAIEDYPGVTLADAAYILATAWHETGTSMEPIKETVFAYHKDKNPNDRLVVNRLEDAWRKGRLPWVTRPYWRFDPDGKAWFGRGFVQLTHKANYVKAGVKLELDLITDPNRVMEPKIAALILVRGSMEGWFTGRKLGDADTYVEDRKVINGTDKAKEIAAHARAFEGALRSAGYETTKGKPKGFFGWFKSLFKG